MRKLFLLAALLALAGVAWTQQSFFEAPTFFSDANTRFPHLVANGEFGIAAYQRIRDAGSGRGTIDVVIQTTRGGLSWSPPEVIAEGIRYEGRAVPPVYSIALNDRNEVLVATVDYDGGAGESGTSIVRVLLSTDRAQTFREVHSVSGDISLVSPRVSPSADGGWFLAMERFDEPSNRVVYSHSEDGRAWDELLTIPADVLHTGTQSDVEHVVVGGRDILLFVGENILPPPVEPGEPDVPDTPQVYAIHTDDSGRSWSATDPQSGDEISGLAGLPVGEDLDVIELAESGLVIPHRYLRVLARGLPAEGALAYQDLAMRRPAVATAAGRRLLTFEIGLRLESDDTRQIAATSIDGAGNISGEIDVLTAAGLRRGDARIPHNQPTPALLGDTAYVVAYQDPGRGGRAVLFEERGGRWRDISPDSGLGVATYPTAARIGEHVHFLWHRRTRNDPDLPTRIVYLEPDQRALPPVVRGENFDIGRRSRSSVARFTWEPREDASGIVAYAYEWTRDPNADVPIPDEPVRERAAAFRADSDGEWYLRIRALDRAGNWSPPGTAEFFRDTTPPGRVAFVPPPLDEDGYLVSNTFTLRWRPPDDDVIGGYFADLVYVDRETAEVEPEALPVVAPPQRNLVEEPQISRENYDNGLWALSVSAVDSVGNVGEPSVLYVRLNKYIPVTEIYTIAAVPDPLGRYNLDILGRGFTANGIVDRVILDRDREPPYDYVFDRSSPGYQVFNNRNMAGPLLDNIETGRYFVGLRHTERGVEFAADRLAIERNGTVKYGAFTVLGETPFTMTTGRVSLLSSASAIAWVVVALMLAVAIFSGSRLVTVAREGVSLRLEARALVASKPSLIAARRQRIAEMRKQGIGLRLKFAFFVVILVMAVVGMIAVGLGSATLNSQQLVLLRGLEDRVDVLMESMVSRAAEPLQDPDVNTLELRELPSSVNAMPEALYATVTGSKSTFQTEDLPSSYNYVWGTNDPLLEVAGVQSAETRQELLSSRAAEGIEREPIPADEQLDLGRTRLDDPIGGKIETLGELVDRIAGERLNNIVREREVTFAITNELRQEINTVSAAGGDPAELEERRERAELTLRSLNRQIETGLDQVLADAMLLLRLAEYEALQVPAGPETEGSEDLSREAIERAVVANAVYEIPDSFQEIESDIERARTQLAGTEEFADQLSSTVKSFPVFVAAEYDPESRDYLFYRGVAEPDISIFPLDREAIERMDEGDLAALSYFRGTVRLGVATDLIVDQINEARRDIVRITALIALAALGAGIAGAIILATIVVIPINKLVRGVEVIRRTQDKSTLKDHQIEVKTRDELYQLADSINTMTVALAAAAEAEKDLIVTSDLQKKFIPLEERSVEGKARKLTMAHLEVAGAEFHGYYEGADALSGDYFTFEWVDKPVEQGGHTFALIKCDVSGHGVNAAFIMVEVATIFLNRVRDWRSTHEQPRLADLVNTVNDLVVERGFQNMFAAMTIAVVDTETGRVRMTHGGDTEQRFYRAATRRVEEQNLNQAPATGMFDRDLFPPGMEYKEFDFQLQHGDLMILATDGIEESARKIRNADFEAVAVDENEFERLTKEALALDPPSSVDVDRNTRIASEEFSTDRMVRVVEQVQSQGSFTLERVRNYDPDERLVFDYKGLEPTARNTVLAITAAEKVFRLTPDMTVDEPIRVDRAIDEFLRDRFSAYRRYFNYPVPDEQRPDASEKFPREEYVYYTHLREEEQADDLTILAIRKK
ncbi:MAG: SpoIIE family protein phosphatase [Spirochaetota bacterium]